MLNILYNVLNASYSMDYLLEIGYDCHIWDIVAHCNHAKWEQCALQSHEYG